MKNIRKIKAIKVGSRYIGDGKPCFIIVDIGCNHDGSLDKAKKMIDAAAEAGVDAVKFQSFTADKMFNPDYDGYKPGWMKMMKSLELPKEWHRVLSDYVTSKGLIFLSTICDEEKVDWLDEVGAPVFKVGSYEMNHLPMLEYAAKKKKPFIISTGIATEEEIKQTLEFLKRQGNDQVAIFHCVSAYPGVLSDLNLRTIIHYKEAFNTPVGLSDHCPDLRSSVIAVASGANLVEKHMTLDKSEKGPDHHFALDPNDLKQWVKGIRSVEEQMELYKKTQKPSTDHQPIIRVHKIHEWTGIETETIEEALGKVKTGPAPGEAFEIYWRRSLWPSRNLPKGTVIKKDDLLVVRPSPPSSLWPKEYYSVIGKKTGEDIKKGQNLTLNAKGELVVNKEWVHAVKGVSTPENNDDKEGSDKRVSKRIFKNKK